MKPKRTFSEDEWNRTPEEVQRYVEALEGRLNRNPDNSNQPPSSEAPYERAKRKAKNTLEPKPVHKKRGARKGHQGHGQAMLEPTCVVDLVPDACPVCGGVNLDRENMEVFHTHQTVEIPPIQLEVTHRRLHKAPCLDCGHVAKATLPREVRTGFGPRLSALIVYLTGICGESRGTVLEFLRFVLGISISTGGIQKVIDRGSEAIAPIYEELGRRARRALVNYIDETSWFLLGKLNWLWVMVNTDVAFFMVHAHRSKQAFLDLIGDWEGILVSDNYVVYRKWVLRQSCLAHLIRRAEELAQSADPAIAAFGRKIGNELKRLVHWAHAPPTFGEWSAFYARFIHQLFSHEARRDRAGLLARLLLRELDSLWLFLEKEGVEPTNNRGERTIRFGALWRKRSLGTQSEKGNRWVERILSLRQTCRMRGVSPFAILVDAIDAHLKGQAPDLSWLTR